MAEIYTEEEPSRSPLAVWAGRIVRFVVCIVLVAVIIGAIYVTCLPAFYQHWLVQQGKAHP